MVSYFKILIIALFFFPVITSAFVLKVGVKESFDGDAVFFLGNVSGNLVKFSSEFYNSGNVPYNARARIDIYESDVYVFSGWSREKPLMAGDRDYFEIFWF